MGRRPGGESRTPAARPPGGNGRADRQPGGGGPPDVTRTVEPLGVIGGTGDLVTSPSNPSLSASTATGATTSANTSASATAVTSVHQGSGVSRIGSIGRRGSAVVLMCL